MNLDLDPRIIAWDQHVRRARTAMSILDVGAQIGLFAGMLFWAGFFWGMIAPASIPEMLLALALSAGYSVVLPMLISLLAPSTPAGMALAETRWRTIGHLLSVVSALFMAYHAFRVLWAWWAARPAVAQTGEDLFLAIGTAIIFIVVPALSWVQIAPDRWIAEIQQAQQVRRLKAAQAANLMAAQLQYARAMALLKRGLANATAAERAELAGTLIAMQRAENEAIGGVADGLRLLTGIDTGVPLLDDPQLLTHYEQLTTGMERMIAPINDADYVELPAPQAPAQYDLRGTIASDGSVIGGDPLYAPVTPHQDGLQRDGDRNSAHARAAQGSAGQRRAAQGSAGDAALVERARVAFPQTLTAKQLAGELDIAEPTARELIGDWVEAGLLDRMRLRGHYGWREEA